MNLIEESTTKQDVEKEYKDYPNVAPEGFKEKPWFWNRLGPIFYETPYGSTVLDIGANTGEFVELLEKDRGCKAFGIDISETCVNEAKEKGRNVQLSNADPIPFPDNYFDVVYLNEVIVHVFDPKAVLKEIKRVLKPTGFLLGSTPHKNLEEKIFSDGRMHRRYYDEVELKQELGAIFEKVYVNVLNGSQFAFSMAHSHMANESAEILFKAGGNGTKPWEEALLDKSVLRVWMGFAHPPAVCYYRMTGFADKMSKTGAEIAYNAFDYSNPDSTSEWQKMVRYRHVQNQFDSILKCADLSVWQISGSMDVIAFLRCIKDVYKKPIVTEMDDWIFDLPASNMASTLYKPNSDAEWCAYNQIKLSDAIICSTNFIKEKVLEMFPDKKIFVVRNSIDFDLWDHVKNFDTLPKKESGVVRIGYTGCGNHDADVEIVKKPLLALLDEYPNLELIWPMRFDSWKEIEHPRVTYVNKWLPFDKYPGMVKAWDLDIGIAPLRDNNFNRAKSNLRWIEYSALKIPTVASKVQPFEESIVSGQTGYLANSQKDWYYRLKGLIESGEERIRIGENAYREMKKNYNMDLVAKEYKEILEKLKRGL